MSSGFHSIQTLVLGRRHKFLQLASLWNPCPIRFVFKRVDVVLFLDGPIPGCHPLFVPLPAYWVAVNQRFLCIVAMQRIVT
jgi:hypothetical protein